MTTPIADFIDGYIESGTSRFHMPGHKGQGDIEKYDITEISGADVLYSADGIIEESENNATKLFGTSHTYYSTEGSTLAIKAMLAVVSKGKQKKILAARNVHKAFVYGCALLDLDIDWLYPKYASHLCECKVTAEDVKIALKKGEASYCAVYVTSPDYLGNIADIKGIAEVCREAGIPLLVDNAHGSYLKFLSSSLHPMDLGAAMCADSAHKTLPVLTGGAYLHVSKDYPELCRGVRSALSLFASTSPSYLTLRSLDLCNTYLEGEYGKRLEECTKNAEILKNKLQRLGFTLEGDEKIKLTVNTAKAGYTGDAVAKILRKERIECEFADSEYVVLMMTPNNTDEDLERLVSSLEKLEVKDELNTERFSLCEGKRITSPRDAILSDSETVNVEDAFGRVCASPSVSCPPAVPIAVSGEIIGEREITLFKKYGIDKVEVIK